MITRWVDYRLRVFYKLDVIFIAWKSANLVKTIVIFLNTVDFERLITEAPGCSLGYAWGVQDPWMFTDMIPSSCASWQLMMDG